VGILAKVMRMNINKRPHVERISYRLARELDRIATYAVAAMAGLVTANTILRRVGCPISGTEEYVPMLAVIVVAFALANCAAQKGHVAISIVLDRCPQRVQAFIEFVVYGISTIFFVMAAWQLVKYGTGFLHSGEVTLTTKMPFYPFIYAESFGLLALCLVLLAGALKALRKVNRG
jgi:TRAP-type C4-dicarboxylate transport system permease small subunit